MYEAVFNCTNEKMRFEFKLQVGALMCGAAALSIANINFDYATKYSGSFFHFFHYICFGLLALIRISSAVFLLHLLSNLQHYWYNSCSSFLILIHFLRTFLHSHISHLHVVILQILKISFQPTIAFQSHHLCPLLTLVHCHPLYLNSCHYFFLPSPVHLSTLILF